MLPELGQHGVRNPCASWINKMEIKAVKNRPGIEEKSRLGRLLVNRGYLTEIQLEDGLRLQRDSGKRLGEVLVEAGWLTERELHRVLRHQSRYRNAAALVTMAVLPFQPMISFAANSQNGSDLNPADAGQMIGEGKFQPLSEAEMGSVSGQAGQAGLFQHVSEVSAMPADARQAENSGEKGPDAIKALEFAANVFVPVLNFLESDLSVTGVHYREGVPRFAIHNDGGLALALPERIEQIRMDNIRVMGSAGASMGNIIISDVQFHAGSSLTIRTR
jgi:hypothetical protein